MSKKEKKVRKAIIIAAGLGTRMYPYTKVESKLMIPILNKPCVEYLIEELIDSGIEEVVIVSNHLSKIQQLFKEDESLKEILSVLGKEELYDKLCAHDHLKFNLILEEKPFGWLHEVLLAKTYLETEPFVILFSDVLYDSKVPATRQLINEFKKTGKNIKSNARFLIKPESYKIIETLNFQLGKDEADIALFKKLSQINDLINYNINGVFLDIGEPFELLKTITYFGLNSKDYKERYLEYIKNDLFKN